MRTSMRGMLALAHHEGVVTNRYKDSVGVWTIGIGATAAALKDSPYNPQKFTGHLEVEQVFDMFKDILVKYERGVNKALKREPKQHEFDAMVSFHYNTGAIARAGWMKLWNADAPDSEITTSFMQWRKPPEILRRRKEECKLLIFGVYPSGDVPLYTADSRGRVQWKNRKVMSQETVVALLEAGGPTIA